MMANSKIRILENLCRTCMGEQETEIIPATAKQPFKSLISIYRKHEANDSGNINIMELLKQTSPQLTVETDDMLPKYICENCLDILVNIHEFHEKSLRVEQRLRNIIKEHYSPEIDVYPLNNNYYQQYEGGEDLKIEIESIKDDTIPVKGFFTLLQKDGKIIEVYNDLEKSEEEDTSSCSENTDSDGGKRKSQSNTAASEARNNENDNLSDVKFWKTIEGDYQDEIPVMKEQNSKEKGFVNGEVNSRSHRYERKRKRLDKSILNRKNTLEIHKYCIIEPENNNPGIKRYQLVENVTSNYNSNTCQNCQSWKNQYETKFDQLTESVNQLKGTIEVLAATSVRQNTIIMEALDTQKVFTDKLLGKEKTEANVRKIFPIQTIDDLAQTDNKIIEANRAVYTSCMSTLLKGQLHKSLTEIFSVDLIVASNIDGIHGKLPLKNFKNFFDALMDVIRGNGEENPEKAIRNALKLIKKRHFHAICVSKKKETKVNNHP